MWGFGVLGCGSQSFGADSGFGVSGFEGFKFQSLLLQGL